MNQLTRKIELDLWEPERFVLLITTCLVGLSIAQVVWRGIGFDWAAYGSIGAIALVCIAGGQFYRISGRSERIGVALTCTGLFAVFSAFMVVFNYLLMPITRPSIDPWLVWIDGLYGYHWPDVMAWSVQQPTASLVLKLVYMSTVPQLAVLVVILGLTGRVRQLHVFLLSVVITSVTGVVFWGMFPSHGPSAMFSLPPEVVRSLNPVVADDYGRELLRLATNGPDYISPENVKGLIAVPSFHAVLAFQAIYAMRGVKWLFPIFLIVNILILPSTLVHGGHHLIDLPIGFLWFLAGLWIAKRTVDSMYRNTDKPPFLTSDLERAGEVAG